jgi:hypothetical protein
MSDVVNQSNLEVRFGQSRVIMAIVLIGLPFIGKSLESHNE